MNLPYIVLEFTGYMMCFFFYYFCLSNHIYVVQFVGITFHRSNDIIFCHDFFCIFLKIKYINQLKNEMFLLKFNY